MRGKEGEVILHVKETSFGSQGLLTKRSPQQPGIPLFDKGAGFEIKISRIQFLCVSIQLIITIYFLFFLADPKYLEVRFSDDYLCGNESNECLQNLLNFAYFEYLF